MSVEVDVWFHTGIPIALKYPSLQKLLHLRLS